MIEESPNVTHWAPIPIRRVQKYKVQESLLIPTQGVYLEASKKLSLKDKKILNTTKGRMLKKAHENDQFEV